MCWQGIYGVQVYMSKRKKIRKNRRNVASGFRVEDEG